MMRALYYIYFWIIAVPLFIVVTIILGLIMTIGSWFNQNNSNFMYYPGVIWSKVTLFLFLCPVEVEGETHLLHNDTPYMVMANHQGAFDIFSIYARLHSPFRWVMKASLRKIPVVGKACHNAGFIFIDGRKKQSIINSIKKAKESFENNTSVVLFPEGTRTSTGKIGNFKRGGFVIAKGLNKEILPITISGSYETLPKGKFTPKPRRIKLYVHPTVSTSDFDDEETLLKEVRNIIASKTK